MWIDSHCHLQDDGFASDLPEVIARAKAAGVDTIVLATSNVEDSAVAVDLALEHGLYTTVGIHPHDASSYNGDSLGELESLVRSANKRARLKGRDNVVVAFGELGLDYHYDFSPRDVQREVFYAQLTLAKTLELPIVFHLREAFQDFFNLVEQAQREQLFLDDTPGVVHCYSGSAEFAKRLLPFGFLFGFDGPLTFKNAKTPLEVVDSLPADRLVLETDAPYLTPVPFRGKRNEPSYVPHIGAKMAEIKKMSPEAMAAITTKNAKRLFRIR